ncbi:MAG: hypothetical protein WCK55_02355 [Verrucomicrobiota bacterium]
MLLIELTFGLLVYAGIWFATIRALRANRSRPRYVVAWSAVLATCVAWLAILFATHGRGIWQLLADSIMRPNEDFFGANMIGLFFTFLIAAPTPIAAAFLCAFPAGRWFASRAPRIAFLLAIAVLMFLHITYHRVATLRIQDQFGNPVPEVKVTYYLDGRSIRPTKPNGELKIGYYDGVHRLWVAEAVAGGYRFDDRLCSHRSNDPIPHELKLPAWKILVAPQLLYNITYAELVTDGRPYYVNVLRDKATDSVDSIADLEVQVDAPTEPPPEPGEFRAKPFIWKVRIRVRQGGWALAPEGYRYLAPERGYQETFEKTYSSTAQAWNFCRENFYLNLRNGRVFAVAEISISISKEKKGHLGVIAKVNPASDRNLFPGKTLGFSESETTPWLRSLFGETY